MFEKPAKNFSSHENGIKIYCVADHGDHGDHEINDLLSLVILYVIFVFSKHSPDNLTQNYGWFTKSKNAYTKMQNESAIVSVKKASSQRMSPRLRPPHFLAGWEHVPRIPLLARDDEFFRNTKSGAKDSTHRTTLCFLRFQRTTPLEYVCL